MNQSLICSNQQNFNPSYENTSLKIINLRSNADSGMIRMEIGNLTKYNEFIIENLLKVKCRYKTRQELHCYHR